MSSFDHLVVSYCMGYGYLLVLPNIANSIVDQNMYNSIHEVMEDWNHVAEDNMCQYGLE